MSRGNLDIYDENLDILCYLYGMGDMGIGDEMLRSRQLASKAATVFLPRTPITTKDLFAGRWPELMSISDAVHQSGLHVVIYGERGVGKTSLANVVGATVWAMDAQGKPAEEQTFRFVMKSVANSEDTFSSLWYRLFAEYQWPNPALSSDNPAYLRSTRESFGLSETLSIDDVRKVISAVDGSVYIVDEFDQASREVTKRFTELIKTSSDLVINCTIILVGVAETVDNLVEDHASISRAISQVKVERMKAQDLKKILENAENALDIKFADDAANLIVHLSQGLPHYTHLIGLNAVRSAADRLSLTIVTREDVFEALKKAVKQAEQSVAEKHTTAIHSAHKRALYRQVLLACAVTAARNHDALGYFSPSAVINPLTDILGKSVSLATFTNHLTEFATEKRGLILERDGQPWGFRYRFRDPLVVPYVFMDGLESGITNDQMLVQMLGQP